MSCHLARESKIMKLRCAPLVGLTALCALLSCQPGRRPLLVALSGVPAEATALRITTTLDGRAAAEDPQELPASATTVTLGLSPDQSGVLRISAEALDPARRSRAGAPPRPAAAPAGRSAAARSGQRWRRRALRSA